METSGFVVYVIDCESTGLDPVENDVIELSICRVVVGQETAEQKTWCLKALNFKSIQEEALRINGHKREDITHLTKFGQETYREPTLVVPEVESWIMEDNLSSLDRIFAGQNPNFDLQMLQELWKKTGSPDTFPFSCERNNRVIDTRQIVTFMDLCIGKRRQYYNLGNLAKSFKVKKGKMHQAAEDTRVTTDLLLTLIKPFRAVAIENFSDCYSEKETDD